MENPVIMRLYVWSEGEETIKKWQLVGGEYCQERLHNAVHHEINSERWILSDSWLRKGQIAE